MSTRRLSVDDPRDSDLDIPLAMGDGRELAGSVASSMVGASAVDATQNLPWPDGQEDIRLRFAPNGEIPFAAFFTRTVLYSWLFARRYGGRFMLRLDDTDLDRQIPGALESYAAGLRWLGLNWDEGPEVGGDFGPYRQSERLGLYRDAVSRLLDEGKAYHCFCDRLRLSELAARARARDSAARPYDGRCRDLTSSKRRAASAAGIRPAVRLKVPDDGDINSVDMLRGPITVAARNLHDFVICRPDGWPTYHLTVVVDDSSMRISHVLRGIEGLSNMAPQAVMHAALGLPTPLYLHFPLVRTPGYQIGDRFLPRGHDLYVDELRDGGYDPRAVVNYYATLGYGYPGSEVRSLDELVVDFDYRRISRKEFVSQALDKLAWMNGRYLRRETPRVVVAKMCADQLMRSGLADSTAAETVMGRAVDIIRPRLAKAADAPALLRFVFSPPNLPALTDGEYLEPRAARDWLCRCAAAATEGQPLSLAIADYADGDRDLRVALTLSVVTVLGGPGVVFSADELAAVLGREETVRRLLAAIDLLQAGTAGGRAVMGCVDD